MQKVLQVQQADGGVRTVRVFLVVPCHPGLNAAV